ncbi:MAG: hypothetical protein NZ765_02835 [Anaerolineae bacterium]|nr:hypothetical protein [Anaerolineae bacterium]MDW8070805.1 hypothetical protein [Anaerolineae bacterium]
MIVLNAFDYLLIMVLLVGATWGALQGMGRLLIWIFSLYIALIIALMTYQPLGYFFLDLVPAFSLIGGQALAFTVVLFIVFGGTNVFVHLANIPPEERRRRGNISLAELRNAGWQIWMQRLLIGPLTTLIGFMVGLMVTAAALSLVLGVLQFLTFAEVMPGTLGANLRDQLRTSSLLPMFNIVLYGLYRAVRIWLPGGEVPGIFLRILMP